MAFLPGPKGHPVDLASLRLEYKRAWGIDITDRVREYIQFRTGSSMCASLSRPRAAIRSNVADVKKQISRRIFTVIIE